GPVRPSRRYVAGPMGGATCSAPLVGTAACHRGQAGVLVEAAVAVQRVADTGDDVVDRVVDVVVPGELVGVERRVDGLHQTLGRDALRGVAVPQVDGPRVTAGLLLDDRSEEHTSELQSRENLVCRLLL